MVFKLPNAAQLFSQSLHNPVRPSHSNTFLHHRIFPRPNNTSGTAFVLPPQTAAGCHDTNTRTCRNQSIPSHRCPSDSQSNHHTCALCLSEICTNMQSHQNRPNSRQWSHTISLGLYIDWNRSRLFGRPCKHPASALPCDLPSFDWDRKRILCQHRLVYCELFLKSGVLMTLLLLRPRVDQFVCWMWWLIVIVFQEDMCNRQVAMTYHLVAMVCVSIV